jgi:glycerol-3-phosphate dehydrogenase (NAD(P)+)
MAIATIVGAGFMGSATAWPLADNGHTVRLVGTHLDGEIIRSCKETRVHPKLQRELPPGVRPYFVEEVAEALEGAEIVVSGVNSSGVRWMGRTLGPHLRPGQAVIAITKGLEADAEGNLSILPDVLRAELPAAIRERVALAAVGGPCIAGELAGLFGNAGALVAGILCYHPLGDWLIGHSRIAGRSAPAVRETRGA